MRKKRTYDPEIKAQARELRGAGHSYRAIARLLDIPSGQTVRNWLDPSAAKKNAQRMAQWRQNNPEGYRQWREQNIEHRRKYDIQYGLENKERKAQYRKDNAEAIVKQKSRYYQENRERIAQRNAQYKKDNPEKVRAGSSKRRADKKNATPPWFTLEHKRQCDALHAEAIRLEQETGTQHHVDHIYPLTGKTRINGKYQHTSCGLHVPWNLKVLPGPDNCSKNCRMPDPTVDPPTAW